jgi:hypothetical protein
MVRCAQCGGEWAAVEETKEVAEVVGSAEVAVDPKPEPAQPVPTVTAMDRLAAHPPASPRSAQLIGAWVLTVVILAAAVSSIIIWREEIMTIWPPSSRILAPADHLPSRLDRPRADTAG